MPVRCAASLVACLLAVACSDDAGGSGTESTSNGSETVGTSMTGMTTGNTMTTAGSNTTEGTTDTTTTAGPTTAPSTTVDPSGDVTGFATTDVDLTTGADLDRVTDGLVALYRFNAGGGTIIEDVSGVGSPLPLSVTSASAVEWNANTLSVTSTTRLLGSGSASKISSACESSEALTLEVWVRAQNANDTNAVVMTLATTTLATQAFTMLQQGGQWAFRLNTGNNNPDGLPEFVASASVQQMAHVVFTRMATGDETVYIDGASAGTNSRMGNFNGWPADPQLSLAADPSNGNRFLGEFGLAAVYCRALSAGEVTQNFNAGY